MTATAPIQDDARPSGGHRTGRHGALDTRIPALDGLRGLAILGVMCLHFMTPRGAGHGLYTALWFGSNAGGTGVDLFFVLSGFLITGILYDAKGSTNYFRAFYMRRVLRIFPLYYGILVGTFVVAASIIPLSSIGLGDPQRHQVWLWLYGTNFGMIRGYEFGRFTHFWSLAVEEQFYLLWPLAVFLLDRKSLVRLLLGCCVGAVLLRMLAAHYGMMRPLISRGMEELAAGALVALVSRGPGGIRRFLSVSGRLALLAVPLAAVGYALRSGHGDLWLQVIKPMFLGWMYAVLLAWVVLAQAGSVLARGLSWVPLRKMGKFSYAMYALHYPASMLLERRFPVLNHLAPLHSATLGALAKILLEIAMSFALGWTSWHLFEKHFLRLKGRFEYRFEPQPVPGAELEAASVAGAQPAQS